MAPARAAGVLDLARARRALLLGNLAVVLLMALLSAVALWQSHAQFRQRALDTAQGQVQALGQALRVRTHRFDVALQAVARIGTDPQALATQVPSHRAVLQPLEHLHVTLSDGQLLPQSGQAPPLSTPRSRQALLDRVLAAPAGSLVFSEPELAADGQTWLMLLARRLQDQPGAPPPRNAVHGVMAHVELRTSVLQELFAQTELGRHGAISLRTQNLSLVARHVGQGPTQQPPGMGTQRVSDGLVQALQARPAAGFYLAVTALDGVERTNAYQRLEPYPLVLLVGLGTADVLQPWVKHATLVAGLLLATTLLLGGLSWGLARSLQRASAAGAGLADAREFLTRTERIATVGGWELQLATGALRCTPEAARILGCPPGQRLSLRQALARLTPGARWALLRHALRQMGGQRGAQTAASGPALPLTLADADADADADARGAVDPPGRGPRRGGTRVRVHVECVRMAGQPHHLVGTLQDVSEQHARDLALAHEQALRQHSEQQVRVLDELLRERKELQDVLAHEVRQPLNNASAALQSAAAALAGTASAAAALPLTRAQTVLGQVIASIDNTLAVANLLASDGPIARADTDLDMLVAVAIGDLPAASRARVQVQRDTAVRTASLDLGLMRLALRNLLVNALAHGTAGTPVTLRLGDSDEPLGLTLDVGNQTSAEGGVPADLVPRLFQRGSRGRHDRPGHGLGLYIVHRVMALHHGRAQLRCNSGGQVVMRLLLRADGADGAEATDGADGADGADAADAADGADGVAAPGGPTRSAAAP